MGEAVDKRAIQAFWQNHVKELDDGTLSDRLMEEAYDAGTVVCDYWERVEGLDQRSINEARPDFLKDLTEDQLLGCIAWHFRADHFDNFHFDDPETVHALQRIVYAWQARMARADQRIVYVFRACPVAPPDARDWQSTFEFRPDGSVKHSECRVSRSTKRIFNEMTEIIASAISEETAAALFEACPLRPNQRIYGDVCDAIINVTLVQEGLTQEKAPASVYPKEANEFLRRVYDAVETVERRLRDNFHA